MASEDIDSGLAFLAGFAFVQSFLLILTGVVFLLITTYVCFAGIFAALFIIFGLGFFIVGRGLMQKEDWAWDYAFGLFFIAAFIHLLAVLGGSLFSFMNFLISAGIIFYMFIGRSDYEKGTPASEYLKYNTNEVSNDPNQWLYELPTEDEIQRIKNSNPKCPMCDCVNLKFYKDGSVVCMVCNQKIPTAKLLIPKRK